MQIEEIDRYCDLFEERLKADDDISIERFLSQHELPPDDQLMLELKRVHQEWRRRKYPGRRGGFWSW